MTEPSTPVCTYRWQIQPGFGFDDAAEQADYLVDLGITHAYLSPILAACPGSTHGYDVIDQGQLNPAAGGRAAFSRLSDALKQHGLGAIADVVPNHMAVPTPEYLNAPLWSVLQAGPHSPFAHWFDIDWSVGDRALLMPVLGQRIGQALTDGHFRIEHLHIDDLQPVLRYFDHVFPLRSGTENLPLVELLDRQWYRLAHWRVADEELNYRRFFDVDTLAAIRVEDPEVFEATHRLLLDLVACGELQGFRIDHPDGLADPAQYLDRLSAATGGIWVVVEKILESTESLPPQWACAGTSGYDALQRLGGVFIDPAGAAPLSSFLTELTGETSSLPEIIRQAKLEVINGGLFAEVHRLVDLLAEICQGELLLRDHTRSALLAATTELLVAMNCYRAYIRPPHPADAQSISIISAAAERAQEFLPDHQHDTLTVVRELVLGRIPDYLAEIIPKELTELVIRFQQTCGPVMAKGVEDTAFYRQVRLISLNEVGGNPDHFGVATEEFHDYFARQQEQWPLGMTTLSTHDTKRSEDVRARLAVLAEAPGLWLEALDEVRKLTQPRPSAVDPVTEYLLWQTLFGTWTGAGPIGIERLLEYSTKAIREAKFKTSWTSPDLSYETAIHDFLRTVLGNSEVCGRMTALAEETFPAWRVNVLGQKLVQLTVPGVPDLYQGCELVSLHLVDPDNRRAVDYQHRRNLLAELDAGAPATDLDREKLLITSRALRLRRDNPHWFISPAAEYQPIATSSGNALAFGRGDGEIQAITVVTRLSRSLLNYGGWSEHSIAVPSGHWRDEFTGHQFTGGSVPLAELLGTLPVALLTRA